MIASHKAPGLDLETITRLGLTHDALEQLAADQQSDFEFDADPETIAEFFQFLADTGQPIDAPAALEFWNDHGPQFETAPAACSRCHSADIGQLNVADRPAYYCRNCRACLENATP